MKRIRIAAIVAVAGVAAAIALLSPVGSAGATRSPGVAEPIPNPWHSIVIG